MNQLTNTLQRLFILTIALILPVTSASTVNAKEQSVVTTIKPVHSLVSAVMKGVQEPYLIVKSAGTPHSYQLKPSDARALSKANIIFRIDEALETFLERPLANLGNKAKVITLMKTKGLKLHNFRKDGPWEGHDHGDHEDHDGHDDHDKHSKHEKHHDHEDHADHEDHKSHAKHEDHEKHDDDHEGHKKHSEHEGHDDHHDDHKDHAKHDHEEAHEHDHGHDHEDEHDHGSTDIHIWLDIDNAKKMVTKIAAVLKKNDAANAAKYESNAAATLKKLDALKVEGQKTLEPVATKPFLVFHDAYQYLEKSLGLKAVGSVTSSPEKMPGARRVIEIQKKIKETGALCIFSEPQFSPKIASAIADGAKIKKGVLDPLGAAEKNGPELYFAMMRNNFAALTSCLGS